MEALADRPAGFRPEGAKPFESLAPLPEVIAASTGVSAAGKNTQTLYEQMLHALGPEFSILREVPVEDIAHTAGPCVAEGIRRLRAGQVERRAGFDGEYGVISLLTPGEIARFSGQISLFGLDLPVRKSKPRRELQRRFGAGSGPGCSPAGGAESPAAGGRHLHRAGNRCDGGPRHRQDQAPWWPGSPGWWRSGASAPGRLPPSPSPIRRRRRCAPGWNSVWAASGRWPAMTIGTFHAICLKLLGDVRLISPGEALTIAEQVLRDVRPKGRRKVAAPGRLPGEKRRFPGGCRSGRGAVRRLSGPAARPGRSGL